MITSRATARISFDLSVDCPHCDEYLDLDDQESFPEINENDGKFTEFFWTVRRWMNNEEDADQPNLYLDCPKCSKAFVVDKIEY